MSKKTKLRKILGILSPESKDALDIADIRDEMKELVKKIPNYSPELNELKNELDSFRKQLSELNNSTELEELTRDYLVRLNEIQEKFKSFSLTVSDDISDLEKIDRDIKEELTDLQSVIKKLRIELVGKMSNLGGGSMNRKETFGGTDYLTKYTDINWKAGNNVTLTVVNNNQTKMVDVTVTASGGGGSVRSINNIAVDTAAGSTAGTDYVYLCTGTLTITLPTAVGNTNLYTIKNVGTGVITVATTSSQTIDGALTQVMPVQFTSIDVISDTANWNIT